MPGSKSDDRDKDLNPAVETEQTGAVTSVKPPEMLEDGYVEAKIEFFEKLLRHGGLSKKIQQKQKVELPRKAGTEEADFVLPAEQSVEETLTDKLDTSEVAMTADAKRALSDKQHAIVEQTIKSESDKLVAAEKAHDDLNSANKKEREKQVFISALVKSLTEEKIVEQQVQASTLSQQQQEARILAEELAGDGSDSAISTSDIFSTGSADGLVVGVDAIAKPQSTSDQGLEIGVTNTSTDDLNKSKTVMFKTFDDQPFTATLEVVKRPGQTDLNTIRVKSDAPIDGDPSEDLECEKKIVSRCCEMFEMARRAKTCEDTQPKMIVHGGHVHLVSCYYALTDICNEAGLVTLDKESKAKRDDALIKSYREKLETKYFRVVDKDGNVIQSPDPKQVAKKFLAVYSSNCQHESDKDAVDHFVKIYEKSITGATRVEHPQEIIAGEGGLFNALHKSNRKSPYGSISELEIVGESNPAFVNLVAQEKLAHACDCTDKYLTGKSDLGKTVKQEVSKQSCQEDVDVRDTAISRRAIR